MPHPWVQNQRFEEGDWVRLKDGEHEILKWMCNYYNTDMLENKFQVVENIEDNMLFVRPTSSSKVTYFYSRRFELI
jgi:hypothetical protein